MEFIERLHCCDTQPSVPGACKIMRRLLRVPALELGIHSGQSAILRVSNYVEKIINPEATATVGAVVRVAAGNFLEMYDLMVYAYYASYIANDIFPSSNHFASLMLTLGTFGA